MDHFFAFQPFIIFIFYRNLEHKTKCKELEVMLKTYTPEANQALSKIQQEFSRKIEAEEKKLAQMRGELVKSIFV